MSNGNAGSSSSARKSILTMSVSQYLNGTSVDTAIKADWGKEKAAKIRDSFDNVGLNLDPKDASGTLKALRNALEGRAWDGVLIGWCIRGHVEFTELFEQVVAVCFDVIKSAPQTKLMFCAGPQNLVETVLRNFPVDNDC